MVQSGKPKSASTHTKRKDLLALPNALLKLENVASSFQSKAKHRCGIYSFIIMIYLLLQVYVSYLYLYVKMVQHPIEYGPNNLTYWTINPKGIRN